jgi:hypothetical protein
MPAYISLHGRGGARELELTALELRFSKGNAWSDAHWRVVGAVETTFRAPEVSTIGAGGPSFATTVVNGAGHAFGPYLTEGVLVGHPHGAHCFIFRINTLELYEGVTVATHSGRLVVVPRVLDPA